MKEKNEVHMTDVVQDLHRYRSSLEFITESFEARKMEPEAQIVRTIAESMAITEEMLQYLLRTHPLSNQL